MSTIRFTEAATPQRLRILVTMSMVEDELLATSVAARLANVSANTIRIWADLGKLPAIRTSCGQRLFRRADVEGVVAQREAIARNTRDARSIVPGGKKPAEPVG